MCVRAGMNKQSWIKWQKMYARIYVMWGFYYYYKNLLEPNDCLRFKLRAGCAIAAASGPSSLFDRTRSVYFPMGRTPRVRVTREPSAFSTICPLSRKGIRMHLVAIWCATKRCKFVGTFFRLNFFGNSPKRERQSHCVQCCVRVRVCSCAQIGACNHLSAVKKSFDTDMMFLYSSGEFFFEGHTHFCKKMWNWNWKCCVCV